MAIDIYGRATTASEPRPNDIITFSPMLGWKYSSFTGRDFLYYNGSWTYTRTIMILSGALGAADYYGKGIVFVDLVHEHEVIPAGSNWWINVYAIADSDLPSTNEYLKCGLFIWRGATDSLKETIGTTLWQFTTFGSYVNFSNLIN